MINYSRSQEQIQSLGVGIIGGRKWVYGNKISFEIYAGPSYCVGFTKIGSTTYILKEWLPFVNGIMPKGGFALGYTIK